MKKPIIVAIALVLEFAATFSLQPNARGADTLVHMDSLEISNSKYQWRYAQSAHFEILSCVDDTKLVACVLQRAEQIITTFEKNCPLFQAHRELPTKIIFINDRAVERFLVLTGKDANQNAFDKPPAGVLSSKPRKGVVRQVSARGYYDDEQIVFLKLFPQNYLEGSTSFEEQVRENAVDLAINYLQVCADTHIAPASAPWLESALNSMRGHKAGGAYKLPDTFASPTYKLSRNVFNRPCWLTINDDEMSVGRYCLACEISLLRQASDFPKGKSEAALLKQQTLWAEFITSPNVNLAEIFETQPDDIGKRGKKTIRDTEAVLTRQREALDFVYYCVFGPDARNRAALATFAASAKRQPLNEVSFQKCFGKSYAVFRNEMYAFFRDIAQKDMDYKDNPWGAPEIVVASYSAKDIPRQIVFRKAQRSETSRIISDWFALCGADELSRQTLLRADSESEQAHEDSSFIAALALNEAASERTFSAITLLEKATARKVVRPEAYRMLARLRLDHIRELKGADHRLSRDELTSIVDPLAEAFVQARSSPQTYIQFAQLWSHTDLKPPKEYLDVLAARCRMIPDNIVLLEAVFPMFVKNGRPNVALDLVLNAAQCILSNDESLRLDALRAQLSTGKSS